MTERGRFLAELRRSNAAGLHIHKPSRSQLRTQAIKEELDLSLAAEYYGVAYEEDYIPTGDHAWLLDDAYEPSPEELDALEAELNEQDPFDEGIVLDPDEYRDEEE